MENLKNGWKKSIQVGQTLPNIKNLGLGYHVSSTELQSNQRRCNVFHNYFPLTQAWLTIGLTGYCSFYGSVLIQAHDCNMVTVYFSIVVLQNEN